MSGGNGAGDTSDGPTALRAKASTLFERASRLSSNYDTHNYPQNFVTGQTEQPTRRTPVVPETGPQLAPIPDEITEADIGREPAFASARLCSALPS